MGTVPGDESRPRSRSRKVFPSRLKTFVKNFGRENRRERRKSEALALEYGQRTSILEPTTSLDPTLNLDPKPNGGDETDANTVQDLLERCSSRASADYSLREVGQSHVYDETQDDSWSNADVTTQDLLRKPGLTVRVALIFYEPLNFSYSRSFDSSATLEVSEKLCRGLIRRIDHSCFEVVTRRDPNALAPVREKGKPKPKRFELTTEISQEGAIWAARTYKSYQKEPLTAEAAKEIVLTSHRMVGLFLKRHDPDFVWKDGPVRDDSFQGPQTTPYRVGHVQPLNCIPRTHFDEQSQTFEATPGFSVEVSLVGRGRQIDGPKWTKEIRVTSNQTSPLTLTLAEALFSDASYALEGAIRSRRQVVQERHYKKCAPNGSPCHHHRDDAVEVNLKVTNDLGPEFEHLERSFQSKMVLFDGAERLERTEFVTKLRQSLVAARDVADDAIARTNDFEFTVVELRGTDWSMDQPITFTLPASVSYSRRSIEAVLERVQTGIAAILRGNANSVRFLAWKRGHFILDKTLVARVPKIETRRWSTPSKTKVKVIERLKKRIEQDIEMICKDTCSLDNLDEDMPSLPQKLAGTAATSVAEESIAQDIPLPQTPSAKDVPRPQTPRATEVPLPQTPPATDIPLPQTPPTHEASGEQTPFATLTRKWSGEFRDGNTNGRAFPLVPSASTFGITELLQRRHTENDEDPFGPTSPMDEDVEYDSKGLIEGTTKSLSEQDAARPRNTSDAKEPSSTEQPIELTVTTARHDGRGTPGSAATLHRPPSFSTTGTSWRPADTASQVSTAPSTPSLVFCNGQSPRGSIVLFTPKLRCSSSMSSAEVELMVARRGSEGYTDDEDGPHAHADPEAYPRWKIAPDEPMSKRLSKSRYAPSPLHREEIIVPETDVLGISHPGESVTPQAHAPTASPPQDPLDQKAQQFVQTILEKDGTLISPISPTSQDMLDQQAEQLARALALDKGPAVSPRSSPKAEETLVQDAQHLVHNILEDGTAPSEDAEPSSPEPQQDPLIQEARRLVKKLSQDYSPRDYSTRSFVDDEEEATPTVSRFTQRLSSGGGLPTSAPRRLQLPIMTSTNETGVQEEVDVEEAVPYTPSSRDHSLDSKFAQTRQDIDFDLSSAFTASPFSQASQATNYGRIDEGLDDEHLTLSRSGSDHHRHAYHEQEHHEQEEREHEHEQDKHEREPVKSKAEQPEHDNKPVPWFSSTSHSPETRSRVGSFSGSAGLLGFSDPRFLELAGLRSTLGSPPHGPRRLFGPNSPLVGLHTGLSAAASAVASSSSAAPSPKDDLSMALPPLLSSSSPSSRRFYDDDDESSVDLSPSRPASWGQEKTVPLLDAPVDDDRSDATTILRRSLSSSHLHEEDDPPRGRRGRPISRGLGIS